MKSQSLYIGYTNDLKQRLKEHTAGKSFATKSKRPHRLIYYQGFLSQGDAIACEKYLKTTRGWQRIHRMLADTLRR